MVALPPNSGTEAVIAPGPTRFDTRRLGHGGLPVPRLRGRLHEMVVAPFGAGGIYLALQTHGALETTATTVFTISIVAMLTAGAAYHCRAGSLELKLTTRRLDHAMIFVAIGGTQTSFWLLVAPSRVAVPIIAVVWLIAVAGIRHKLSHLTLTHTSGSSLYMTLGWTGVALVPYLVGAGDRVAITAVIGGGVVTPQEALCSHDA